MEYYLVSPLRVIHGRESSLTYHSDRPLKRGEIVSVQVGKRDVAAVVLKKIDKPAFNTKPINASIESRPLPEHLLKLHDWLADYYQTHAVAVWQTMLPSGLLKKRRIRNDIVSHPERNRVKFVFNTHQTKALDQILNNPVDTTLLHGVTGSGKTAVYIEAAKRVIGAGKSAIIIVPEISLTSQLVAEFAPHFPRVVLTHSTMTEAARHQAWRSALYAEEPTVIIGPRSALFSPLPNLGLVIIDECHEPSLKQEQSPRYSALRAAAILTKYAGAKLVLGSATPSVADYYLAQSSSPDSIVEMPTVAQTNAIKPDVELVDMTKRAHFGRSHFLSTKLIEAIDLALKNNQQALLFHNRRGSASTTLCENCGWSAACPRCFIPLTLHNDTYQLRCHVCDYHDRVPTTCPDCGQAGVIHKGIGTKRIAEEVARLFPTARIARFDGDNEAGETLDKQYQALYDGDIDIIIGTQVVAKGLDLPHLRLVGVVQADSGLSLPDYYAEERVFQLLAQVAGRVGRNEHPSRVIIQSYQPSHPSVQFGISQDYRGFYTHCISERKRGNFPPFTHLLKLSCVYKSEAAAVRAARQLANQLKQVMPPDCQLFGPTPAFYERAHDTYRWQLILKSPKRGELIALIDHVPASKWQIELDPLSLL